MIVGGRERLIVEQAAVRGPESTSIICFQEVGVLGEKLRAEGFRVDVAGWGQGLRASFAWRLAKLMREHQAEVVHCHHIISHRYGAFCARAGAGFRRRTPRVFLTVHGPLDLPNGPRGQMNRRLMRRTQVVTVSKEMRGVMEQWLGPSDAPVQFIHNGISPAPYLNLPAKNAARAELGLPQDAFLIGHIGRIDWAKGHITLVDSLSRIRIQFPKATVVMVGDGPLRGEVEKRIRALELESNVILMGERHDVPMILAALDVLCLPSDKEGMPLVILEAMAAAKPIVATPVGDIPEMLDQGRCGVLVPHGQLAALDRALLAMAHDPERAAALGEAARQHMIGNYSFEAMVAAYEALYRGN